MCGIGALKFMVNYEKQGKRVEPNKSKLNKELLIHTYDSKKVSFLFFLLSPKIYIKNQASRALVGRRYLRSSHRAAPSWRSPFALGAQ